MTVQICMNNLWGWNYQWACSVPFKYDDNTPLSHSRSMGITLGNDIVPGELDLRAMCKILLDHIEHRCLRFIVSIRSWHNSWRCRTRTSSTRGIESHGKGESRCSSIIKRYGETPRSGTDNAWWMATDPASWRREWLQSGTPVEKTARCTELYCRVWWSSLVRSHKSVTNT